MKKRLCYSLFLLIFISLAGCRNAVYLQKTGAQGRINYDDTFVFSGGLSADTINLLSNHLLSEQMHDDPEKFINELEMLYKRERSPRTMVAIAETSQAIAEKMRNKDPDTAIRYDLTTLIYTNLFFQYVIERQSQVLFDPEVIVAVKCYNLALTEIFAFLHERGLHRAGGFELTAAGGQSMFFTPPECLLPVDSNKITSFHLCSDFRPQNLTHSSRSFGIGVPLICELANNAIPETVFAEEQVIPATLAVDLKIPEDNKNRRQVQLIYLDSRSLDNVTVNDTVLPLAQDFSTPLAYMIRKPQIFNFIQRAFLINKQSEGLYHLEPHNDKRIPVILVHGFMSDIRTWMQLINTLLSDPELRKNYRFMGFSYSSGNPIFISAMHLREALLKERAKLLKDGHDLTKFDQMILVGHSMGGLISRLMISESNDKLLEDFIGRDVYSQAVGKEDKEFRDLMIFSPVPSVKRVIYIAVPHRGSELAQSLVAQVASSMIKIPESLIEFDKKIIRTIFAQPDNEQEKIVHEFNGISNLSPDDTALRLLNFIPMTKNVPYHSIIGNEKKGGVPGGSDGVVSYSSCHLEGAKSEIVVHSDHSVQQNPLAIQEIKRILKEHLKSAKNE